MDEPRASAASVPDPEHMTAFRVWSTVERSRDQSLASSLFYDADRVFDGAGTRIFDSVVSYAEPRSCGHVCESAESSADDSGSSLGPASFEDPYEDGLASPHSPLDFCGAEWGNVQGLEQNWEESEIQTDGQRQDSGRPPVKKEEQCQIRSQMKSYSTIVHSMREGHSDANKQTGGNASESQEAAAPSLIFLAHQLPRDCLLLLLQRSFRANQIDMVVRVHVCLCICVCLFVTCVCQYTVSPAR